MKAIAASSPTAVIIAFAGVMSSAVLGRVRRMVRHAFGPARIAHGGLPRSVVRRSGPGSPERATAAREGQLALEVEKWWTRRPSGGTRVQS